MTNRQIARHIRAFKQVRQQWIDILVDNPNQTDAPRHIVDINAKIELLTTLWNWASDEDVELP